MGGNAHNASFYCAAETVENAVEQFKITQHVGWQYEDEWNTTVPQWYHTLHTHSAPHSNLDTDECVNFMFNNSFLNETQCDELGIVFNWFPQIVQDYYIFDAARNGMAKTLHHLLTVFPDYNVSTKDVMAALENYYTNTFDILINSGRFHDFNPEYSVLAWACDNVRKDVFDKILPLSNLEYALKHADNKQWVEEAIALQQKQTLLNVIEQGVQQKLRKI